MDKGLGNLNASEIDELLLNSCIGRIGCSANSRTLVVPITYAYDGERILAHTTVGEKVAMMRENPSVCFEVDQVDDLRNWQSVIIQGSYRELQGSEASIAMAYLVEKLLLRLPSESAMLGNGAWTIRPKPTVGESETVLFCIDITEKRGRYEKWKTH